MVGLRVCLAGLRMAVRVWLEKLSEGLVYYFVLAGPNRFKICLRIKDKETIFARSSALVFLRERDLWDARGACS